MSARRATGPNPETVQLVLDRSDGHCEKCQVRPAEQVHHRCSRQMGGSRRTAWINKPSNLVYLCAGCHRDVTVNVEQARENGWVVQRAVAERMHGPQRVAIVDDFRDAFHLDNYGNKIPVARPRGENTHPED